MSGETVFRNQHISSTMVHVEQIADITNSKQSSQSHIVTSCLRNNIYVVSFGKFEEKKHCPKECLERR